MSAFVFAVMPNEVELLSLGAQLECWKVRDRIIAMKTLINSKGLTIISVVLMVLVAGGYSTARAESSDQDAGIVAQNETQTATDEKKASSTESNEPEIKADKVQDSSVGKKKPLEDFQPSEKIEAEQAVDFPYDI
jgi:hypothetical protein